MLNLGGWHSINWPEDTMSLISRMSASIFVGSEMARDLEWQNLTTTYTVNLFKAVGALRQWPGFLRPLVHQFLPQSKVCREQVKLVHEKVQAVLERREAERVAAGDDGRVIKSYEDTITWFEETAAGRPYDRAAAQLALAISALHTTSEAFRQVLLDVCLHPNILQPMREEMEAAVRENGWTIATLAKMQLVDSVMKESQRFKSAIG
jgi:Cytochrome P450